MFLWHFPCQLIYLDDDSKSLHEERVVLTISIHLKLVCLWLGTPETPQNDHF